MGWAWSSMLGVVVVGCAGGGASLVGKDELARQADIRASCDAAERGHDDPFTVEWDATDVASFEAQAQRDTVFVKYHGCDLQVLGDCRDPRVPGQLGGYEPPAFTSGAERSLDIHNEGDLYANLPLGAAKLGARVSGGEALRLRYFVSGLTSDSRGAFYRNELASIAGCEGATHFVAAYNVGAFVVETMEKSGATAGVSTAGASAGGDTSHEASGLGAGGSIASCSSAAKETCRVPIRLHLRRITAGAAPASTTVAVAGTGAPPAPSLDDFAAWAMRVQQVQGGARQKLDAGDAKACLATLDVDLGYKQREAVPAVNQASMAMVYEGGMLLVKGECQAAGGDCSAGTATTKDGLRLQAAGADLQSPGRHLKDDAEKSIGNGAAENLLQRRCGHH
jgi:hypothetical protein